VYEKHNMIFSFEKLGRMHKNIFFLFFKFFCILEVLTKTGYFNTGFVFFFGIKIPTKYKTKFSKKITENNYNFLKRKFFFNWVGPGPTILGWVGVASPLNSGLLHYSHAT